MKRGRESRGEAPLNRDSNLAKVCFYIYGGEMRKWNEHCYCEVTVDDSRPSAGATASLSCPSMWIPRQERNPTGKAAHVWLPSLCHPEWKVVPKLRCVYVNPLSWTWKCWLGRLRFKFGIPHLWRWYVWLPFIKKAWWRSILCLILSPYHSWPHSGRCRVE